MKCYSHKTMIKSFLVLTIGVVLNKSCCASLVQLAITLSQCLVLLFHPRQQASGTAH